MNFISKKFSEKQVLIIIFGLIFLFRFFYGMNHLVFSQDQSRDAMLMQAYKNSGFAFIGYGPKASVGDFYLAPLYYQVSFWVFLITQSELGIEYFTIIVESFTPVILYIGLRTIFSKNISLMASLTYALGAQITLYAVMAWNPNMIPFLAALVLTSALKLSDNKTCNYWIVGVILPTAVAIHFHFQGAILIPFVLVQIVSYVMQKRNLLPLLIAVVLAISTFAPYVVTESTHSFANTKNIITFLTKDHPRIYDRVSKIDYVTSYFALFLERLMVRFSTYHHWFALSIWYGGLFSSVIALYRESNKRRALVVWFTYFVSLLIMLRVYKGDKLDFYIGPAYLFIAYFIAFIAHFRYKIGLLISIIIVFLSGRELSKIPNSNGYRQVNDLCNSLSAFQQPISPFVINQDLTSYIAYCRLKGLEIDYSSPLVVYFCNPNSGCTNSQDTNLLYCTSRDENIMRMHKQISKYKSISKYESSTIDFQAGSVSKITNDFVLTKDITKPNLLPNNPIPAWMEKEINFNRYL